MRLVAAGRPGGGLGGVEELGWGGKEEAGLGMLVAVQKGAGGDPRLVFLYGLTCAKIGAYERAETAFNVLLAQRPDDFDVLFNLGRAAARGGGGSTTRGDRRGVKRKRRGWQSESWRRLDLFERKRHDHGKDPEMASLE